MEKEQSFWLIKSQQLALSALLTLKEQTPNTFIYLIDPLYFQFLFHINDSRKLGLKMLPLGSNIPEQNPKDAICVVARPSQILKYANTIPQINQITFYSIPIKSYLTKTTTWKYPIKIHSYHQLCIPFVPMRKCLLMPIGSFKSLFLSEPVFENKALKSSLLSLGFLFGGIARTYAIGEYSSSILPGFLDAMGSQNQESNNNLILIDRTVDLLSVLQTSQSYITLLEELLGFDPAAFGLTGETQKKVLGGVTPVFTEHDDMFDTLALSPPAEALRMAQSAMIRTGIRETIQSTHIKLLQELEEIVLDDYLISLLHEIQNNKKDASLYGRVFAVSDNGPALLFRAISYLWATGQKQPAKSLARLAGAKFGIPTFARWNRLEPFLQNYKQIDCPQCIKSITTTIPTIAAVFARIILDDWKRPKFPISPSHFSTMQPISKEPQKWFVSVVGGMTSTEIALFHSIIRKCRPNDELILIPTQLYSPNLFMNDIIR